MKIYIIRHEDRTQDATFFSPLTSIGIENSKLLSKLLKKININLIFSSPFIRTLQTITTYANEVKLPIKIDYALVESINPYIIPQNSYNVSLPKYIANYFNVEPTYKSIISPDELIWNEKIKDIKKRVKKFLYYLINTYAKTNKNIIIVTHQVIINCIININNKKHCIEYNYPKGKITKIFDTNRWTMEPINWKYL